MRFVAKCNDCGEQKILNEWGECKRCLNIFKKTLRVPADHLTDKNSWYTFPIKQIQATIITDDRYEPQPDPAKIDAAVTEHAAEVQKQLNLTMREMLASPTVDKGLRKIFASYSEQKTYPTEYQLGSKSREKI